MEHSNRTINVAYVLPQLVLGGTEKHVRDLATHLDRRRFRPIVITIYEGDGVGKDTLPSDIPAYVVGFGTSRIRLRRAASFFRRIVGILKEERIDILHAYLPAANVLGTAAGMLAGVRIKIVSKRALCQHKEGHPVFSFFENLSNLSADALMVNSLSVAEDVRRTERFCEGKMFLVYNGIDPADEPARSEHATPPVDLLLPPDTILLSYIAHLREDKGHLCLIEAAPMILASFPTARLLFVGREGVEAPEVRRRIEALGLSERVILTGPRGDVPRILKASRVVAHPGIEGFSNAILEAMAEGVPVVAARVGGNREAVIDGETGYLVPPGDAGAFADAIRKLLQDPSLARRLGEAGRRRVEERFSLDRMVACVEQTYSELIGGRQLSCRVKPA